MSTKLTLAIAAFLLLTGCSHNPLASPTCNLSPEEFVTLWHDECECSVKHYAKEFATVSWEAVAKGRVDDGTFYEFLAADGKLQLSVFLKGHHDDCVPRIKPGTRYCIEGWIGSVSSCHYDADYGVIISDATITKLPDCCK